MVLVIESLHPRRELRVDREGKEVTNQLRIKLELTPSFHSPFSSIPTYSLSYTLHQFSHSHQGDERRG